MLITYERYKELGGSLDDAAFNLYCYEAERKVQTVACGRVKRTTEPIERCIVRLTDILSASDITQEKITSWSNDGVSQSIKEVSRDEYNAKIENVILEYLSEEVDEKGVPLLYQGVDYD